jgi:hypothetical protein
MDVEVGGGGGCAGPGGGGEDGLDCAGWIGTAQVGSRFVREAKAWPLYAAATAEGPVMGTGVPQAVSARRPGDRPLFSLKGLMWRGAKQTRTRREYKVGMDVRAQQGSKAARQQGSKARGNHLNSTVFLSLLSRVTFARLCDCLHSQNRHMVALVSLACTVRKRFEKLSPVSCAPIHSRPHTSALATYPVFLGAGTPAPAGGTVPALCRVDGRSCDSGSPAIAPAPRASADPAARRWCSFGRGSGAGVPLAATNPPPAVPAGPTIMPRGTAMGTPDAAEADPNDCRTQSRDVQAPGKGHTATRPGVLPLPLPLPLLLPLPTPLPLLLPKPTPVPEAAAGWGAEFSSNPRWVADA